MNYLHSTQVQLYLVDAFAFPASALSAASFFQSLLGFAFPVFGQMMYTKFGYGGGYSLLAGLAIVIGIPFPIWIWYKGEDIRKRSTTFLSSDVRLFIHVLSLWIIQFIAGRIICVI
jgi:hypothetical protein